MRRQSLSGEFPRSSLDRAFERFRVDDGLMARYPDAVFMHDLAADRGEEVEQCLDGRLGSARLARPPGVKVAGKTGTASDPGNGQIHAWFAGYAPAESPRIAVMVFLEQGVGGRDAAPIARQLIQLALQAP